MARSHTPLSVWFWSAYLVSSQTPGVSAVQLRRQLGLSRYETAFQILHKLRAGMVRPDQDRIGGRPGEHVEVDETWAGGRTRGKGRGVHDKVLVASAVEVRQRKPGTKLDKRKGGRYAGRVRLAIVPDRGSIRSTPSVPCSASRATSPHRPTQSFTPEPGSILHVGGVGNNRIGKLPSTSDTRGSRQSPRGGKAQRCSPHPADPPARSESCLPPKSAAGSRGADGGQSIVAAIMLSSTN